MEGEGRKGLLIAIVIAFIWLIALTVFNFSGITGMATAENNKWVCANAVCEEAYTLKEIQNQFCDFENNEIVCGISYNGQDTKLPISQINWSNIQPGCKKVRCIQEALTRDVNYTLDQNQTF